MRSDRTLRSLKPCTLRNVEGRLGNLSEDVELIWNSSKPGGEF
jgi:hypothetical protein